MMMVTYILLISVGLLSIQQTSVLQILSQSPDFKGTPTQSLSYQNMYQAENALDGQFEEHAGEKATCSITIASPPQSRAWWKIPLKKISNVAYLQIYFRNSTVNRHVGFSVYVFNDSSFVPPFNGSEYKVFTQDITTCPDRVMNITVNRLTKGIALYIAKEPPVMTSCPGYSTFATIEVCEVQVFGCLGENFGGSCHPCDSKCLNKHCDAFNGSCIYGCSNPQKKFPDCTVCRSGYYGVSCDRVCGKCLNGTICDPNNGICPNGCQDNWSGLKCDDEVSTIVFYSVIAILTFLLAIATGVMIYQRCRISSLLQDKNNTDNTQTESQTKPHSYDNLAALNDQYEYTTLELTQQKPQYDVPCVF